MGLQSAMYSAVSGLNANGNAMSVIGNNISNSNTTAYKSNRTLFSDVLAQEVSAADGSSQIGRGVNTATVDTDFSQGTFKSTSSNTDLAVDGPGFFIMGQPGSGTINYTRDGAFNLNEEGYLVNPTGYRVQGYQLNEKEKAIGDLTDVLVNTNASIPAKQTANVTTVTNLNADKQANTSGSFGGTYEGWDYDGSGDKIEFNMKLAGQNIFSSDLTVTTPDPGGTPSIRGAIEEAITSSSTSFNGKFKDDGTNFADGKKLYIDSNEDGSFNDGETCIEIIRNSDNGFDFITTNGANFSITNFNDGNESGAGNVAKLKVTSDALGTQTTLESGSNTSAYAFDSSNPDETSDFSSSVTAYDSLGDPHTITTYFKKISNNIWDFHCLAPKEELSSVDGTSVTGTGFMEVGGGEINFTSSGEFENISNKTTAPITWNNGSAPGQQITFNFDKLTQYSGQSEVVRQEQDGNASGNLVDVSVDREGNVIANYSNGESQKEFRLGLAQFSNEDGLSRVGNNLFAATAESGQPAIGKPGSSVGTIRSNSLEQSNVDIAKEFTNMITTQRAYQANSRTISTTDDMLQEVINLTR